MARKKQIKPRAKPKDTKKANLIAGQAGAIAEFAASALVAAEKLRIKSKSVEQFPLDEDERATVATLPALPPTLKKKLTKPAADFTFAEAASITMAVADALPEAEPMQRIALLVIAKNLMDCLFHNIAMTGEPANGKTPKSTDNVYQLKITLLESHPPIWRRIQVQDCTLDKLHEHIQTAMGWTNSHLHQFKLGKQLYADPMLMEQDFDEFGCQDSTTTKISDILPQGRKRFRLVYEYDFGDSWEHEVLFEGCVQDESKVKYPLCLEGARACPPEDCGGVWGYADFVQAIQNKDHEQHEEMLEWVGGRFDPEAFSPAKVTKAMRKGLPDWRSMADQ